MKVSASSIDQTAMAEQSWVSVFSQLVKARLTLLVLLTAMVGFYAGSHGRVDYLLLCHTLFGTALLASGASALNQWIERDLDALMSRTQDRPLPSGRLRPRTVLVFGIACSVIGIGYLGWVVNPLSGLLGTATLFLYVAVYTPLKRVTSLNTVIGAIPGAIPPVLGWAAASGEISGGGWALFAIQFFWQIPHFLAISWLYREDYARAGFKMLAVTDTDGGQTGHQAVSHALGLLAVSLCPFVFGVAGPVYLMGALVLGVLFLWFSVRFARGLRRENARLLFLVSIIYLPLVLGLIVMDKVG